MDKKISVIMAFICNPYLAVLQRRSYLKYWKDEIGELLVNVNGRNNKIRKFIVDLWEGDDKITFVDNVDWEMRQGRAFDGLYSKVKGDILVTMDSDNFVYRGGVLNKFSNMLLKGEYDCVGSSGLHSYPPQVTKLAMSKYGIVRLNPFMSFWKKEIIDRIENPTFETYNYKEGDEFKPLGKIPAGGWMDVMSKFSLDYFYFSKRYLLIPQTQPGEYVHFGGISSIFRRKFKSLEDEDSQKFKETALDPWHEIHYWANYDLIYEATKDEVPNWYNKEYRKGLDLEINKAEMPRDKIEEIKNNFKIQHKGLFYYE